MHYSKQRQLIAFGLCLEQGFWRVPLFLSRGDDLRHHRAAAVWSFNASSIGAESHVSISSWAPQDHRHGLLMDRPNDRH